jgi:hypothetical protein
MKISKDGIENKYNIEFQDSEFVHTEYFIEGIDEKDKKVLEIINTLKLIIPDIYKFIIEKEGKGLRLMCHSPARELIHEHMIDYIFHFSEAFFSFYIGLYNFAYKNKKVCIYFSPSEIEHKRESFIPDINDDEPVLNHKIKFRLNKIKFGYYIHQPGKEMRSGLEKEFEVTDMPHILDIDLPDLNEPTEDFEEDFFAILRSFDISTLEKIREEIKNDSLKKLDKRFRNLKEFYSTYQAPFGNKIL